MQVKYHNINGIENMIYKDLGKIVRFFCDNTTIPGFTWLTMKKISFLERMFWIIINTAVFITTFFLLRYLWEEIIETPTIVTLVSRNLPVQSINFPGIAICGVNKISRKKATEFATYLNQFTVNKNVSEILRDIKLLGNLYDFNLRNVEGLALAQDFFDAFDNYGGIDDPMKRMVQLAPKCDEMLKRCRWDGINHDCEELFLLRTTYDGYCCVFNYLRKVTKHLAYSTKSNKSAPSEYVYPKSAGVNRGLRVTLYNNIDDYFFSTFPALGYTVQIFNADDFPDKMSGSLTELFVNAGTEALISMEYSRTTTTDVVRSLPINLRNCKFHNDQRTIFGNYTFSDCLVECKIRSILSLCNCIPFTVPVLEEHYNAGDMVHCNLIDIPCLNKYREKWSRYYPYGVENDILNQEKHDSISCTECLPDCNSINYDPSIVSMPLQDESSNTTHINIFFNSAFGNSYQIDVTQTWFEVISNLGGFLSLLMGVSVISLIEVFIFLYRIGRYCVNKSYSKPGDE